jgi:hypothetical protein
MIIPILIGFVIALLLLCNCNETFVDDNSFSRPLHKINITRTTKLDKPYKETRKINKKKNRPYDYFDYYNFRNSYEYKIYGDNLETGELKNCFCN